MFIDIKCRSQARIAAWSWANRPRMRLLLSNQWGAFHVFWLGGIQPVKSQRLLVIKCCFKYNYWNVFIVGGLQRRNRLTNKHETRLRPNLKLSCIECDALPERDIRSVLAFILVFPAFP